MSVTGTDINLTLRQVKGSELTYAELDGNQSNLKTAIESHSHDEFASSNHNHLGVYQQVMGADDNYVTDTEKAALHAHTNKTALDNVSGINTGDQDLSGYSLTTHNHTLSGLSEKSYNSLTDKPTIPSITGLLNEASHDVLDHTGLTGILALGTTGTTACAGNDTRLSDARTPLAHTTLSHSDWPAAVSMAEVAYLDGVTSSVQAQLNGKENLSAKGQALGYCPLDGSAKVAEAYLPDSVLGQVEYQGTWNATTNVPIIPAASTTNKGWYYIVATSGTTNIDGTAEWTIGDWIVSNGTTWNKVDNTDSVSSVFGRAGAIVANAGDYTASQVTNVPAGNISATTVQAAINELDTEKASATDGRFVTNGDNHDHAGGDGAAISLTSAVTGILPVASGGTGSSTQNFVDLTSNQTIGGVKTFSSNLILGTPASGDLRNCSLAVAPAIGGTTPNSGAFTSLSASGAVTTASQLKMSRNLTDSASRRNWCWDTEHSVIGDCVLLVSTSNTGDPASGTAVLSAHSSGNVLIGTTTDNGVNKLQVSGSGYFSSSVGIGGVLSVAGSVSTGYSTVSGAGNASINTTYFHNWIVTGGATNYGTVRMTDNATYSAFINWNNAGLQLVGPSATSGIILPPSGNLLVKTPVDDGVNALQVSGSIKATGLSVAGNIIGEGVSGLILNGGSSEYVGNVDYLIQLKQPYGSAFGGNGTGILLGARAAGGNENIGAIYAELTNGALPAGDLVFATRNAGTDPVARMKLSSSGNLLVGTTTDDGVNKLQVGGSGYFSGNLNVNGAITATQNGNTFGDNTFTAYVNNYAYLTGNTSGLFLSNNATGNCRININSSNFIAFEVASAERMRLSSTGLIVGTTDSTSIVSAGGLNTHLTVQAVGPDGTVIFKTNGAERARVTSTGLSVAGTIYATALPTSDPHVAGAFWRSENTVMVSTG